MADKRRAKDRDTEPRGGRRRGAGRAARLAQRQSGDAAKSIWPGLAGGQYRPLSEPDIKRIHAAALDILATTGIRAKLPIRLAPEAMTAASGRW